MIANIAILVATVLALLFPACLITAIRSEDEKTANSSKTKACVLFAAIVFLLGALINS